MCQIRYVEKTKFDIIFNKTLEHIFLMKLILY